MSKIFLWKQEHPTHSSVTVNPGRIPGVSSLDTPHNTTRYSSQSSAPQYESWSMYEPTRECCQRQQRRIPRLKYTKHKRKWVNLSVKNKQNCETNSSTFKESFLIHRCRRHYIHHMSGIPWVWISSESQLRSEYGPKFGYLVKLCPCWRCKNWCHAY